MASSEVKHDSAVEQQQPPNPLFATPAESPRELESGEILDLLDMLRSHPPPDASSTNSEPDIDLIENPQPWDTFAETWKEIKVLAAGKYGQVSLCLWQQDFNAGIAGRIFAVKRAKSMQAVHGGIHTLHHEVSQHFALMGYKLDGSFTESIDIVGIWTVPMLSHSGGPDAPPPTWIAFPYIHGKSLKDIFAKQLILPASFIFSVIRDLLHSVQFLHGNGMTGTRPKMAHLDIHPGNIMIDFTVDDARHWPRAKLADFGAAESFADDYLQGNDNVDAAKAQDEDISYLGNLIRYLVGGGPDGVYEGTDDIPAFTNGLNRRYWEYIEDHMDNGTHQSPSATISEIIIAVDAWLQYQIEATYDEVKYRAFIAIHTPPRVDHLVSQVLEPVRHQALIEEANQYLQTDPNGYAQDFGLPTTDGGRLVLNPEDLHFWNLKYRLEARRQVQAGVSAGPSRDSNPPIPFSMSEELRSNPSPATKPPTGLPDLPDYESYANEVDHTRPAALFSTSFQSDSVTNFGELAQSENIEDTKKLPQVPRTWPLSVEEYTAMMARVDRIHQDMAAESKKILVELEAEEMEEDFKMLRVRKRAAPGQSHRERSRKRRKHMLEYRVVKQRFDPNPWKASQENRNYKILRDLMKNAKKREGIEAHIDTEPCYTM